MKFKKQNWLASSMIGILFTSILSTTVNPINVHANQFTPGVYESKASGFSGDVSLTVTIDEEGKLSDIQVEHDETTDIGGAAIDELTEKAVSNQTANLEVVTGATISSEAFVKSLTNILQQASGSVESDVAAVIQYIPGTYKGIGEGMGGDIEVIVTVSENRIDAIEFGEENETAGIAEQVFETLPRQVIDYQTLDVDIISGATVSSIGVKMGLEDALTQAGADIEALKKAPMTEHKEDGEYNYDVVVAGGGLAGLTAALKAAKDGRNVALVEKLGILGGTGIFASGNILGANAEEYVEPMFDAWMARSKSQEANPVNQELVRSLAGKSPEVMALMDEIGVEFNLEVDEDKNFQTYRAKPNERAIKNAESIRIPSKEANKKGGSQWLSKLTVAVEEAGVDIYLNTPVTQLLTENGAVVGLVSDTEKYGNKVFNAKSVVLATGDYARNNEMTQEIAPHAVGEYSATSIGNTGEVIKMALDVGAVLTDYQELMSGVFNANPYDMPMIGDPTNGYPFEALLVDYNGDRKYAEDGGSHPQKFHFLNPEGLNGAWAIMDEEIAQEFVRLEEYLQRTEDGDEIIQVYQADTIEELAQFMDLPVEKIVTSVNRYNEMVKQGEDTDFGKDPKYLSAIDEGPFYAAKLYDATRGNYGGIVTDKNAAVLDKDGQPIVGLYAAGTISSGEYFGDYYPGRQALGIASHMGYVAGEQAASNAE